MDDELWSRYSRLRHELAEAYTAPTWRAARIDRLVDELTATERRLAACQPFDEQTNDSFPAFVR